MATTDGERGFFAYYREYAQTGVHAASAAALTALGLFASLTGNQIFIVLAIAAYVLPLVFLYLSGEGENVPSVVGSDTGDSVGDESSGDGETGPGRVGSADEAETEPGVAVENRGDREDRAAEPDETTATADEQPPDRSETGDTATDRHSESDSTGGAPEPDLGTAETDTDVADTESRTDETESETAEPDSNAGVGDADSGVTGRESAEGTDTTRETDTAGESVAEEVGTDEADSDTTDVEPGWNEADTPTGEPLLDVVSVRDGAYAVGDGGVVLVRNDDWEVAVERGPTAESNPLRGVDATADGGAVWFAGDSGVLGRYEDGRLTDHSAPEDQTSTWEDVAVTDETGRERIHLVNGSGELLRGTYEDGQVSWEETEKPGSGSSISAIKFVDSDRGHFCDTNQGVYETTDGGETYEKIGIEDANAAFTGVAAAESTVVVSCDDGSVFRYDGAVWTRLHAAENALSAIAFVGERGLAAGDAGAVFELVDGDWESVETPVDTDLAGVVVGDTDGPDIAVGTDGTVIERQG